ncbi:MAG: Druantia anti-phage system protein DruA [Dehalococcoidia bacterium]
MYLFRPRVAQQRAAHDLLTVTAQRLSDTGPDLIERIRACALHQIDEIDGDEDTALQLRIALSALCDLRAHDWEIVVDDQDDVRVAHPDRTGLDPEKHKNHVRDSFLVERDAQLAEPATRRFVSGMERQREHGPKFRSVFDLMRDGAELAAALERVRDVPRGPQRTEALRAIIDPYVQVVETGTKCEHTGLGLQDIWRYFRHTWATPYRSVPGRQISFLVRDRAAKHHPVIGIGSLASSVVQQGRRDRWIGWHHDVFLEALEADQYKGWSRWLLDRLEDMINEIYVDDLLGEGILATGDLSDPHEETVERLREVSTKARESHRLYRQEEQHKSAGTTSDVDWRAQAETFLFRSKRAGRLADLLRARRDLNKAGLTKSSPETLRKVAGTTAGKRAIRTVLRFVKAAHVGIDMMDISVCGAVDPYRPILGGKLVSLLLASPDVGKAYAFRYGDAASIIASSMAGKALNRPPHLVLLMTTSLYSVAAAQYNRLKVRSQDHGGEGTLEYQDLEHTAGFGSYHFSKATLDAMEVLLARSERGREVNSIFGEGVNPRLRKIRAALEAVGLPSDHLLKHGSKRIVYSIPLASNFRDILIGRAHRPKYHVEQSPEGTQSLIDFWYERWLGKRIDRDGVLERVARHTTCYPVEHGARVPLSSERGCHSPSLSLP